MRTMANAGARGLQGRAAIDAIVRRFERPAAPGAEVQRALGHYRSMSGQAPPGYTAPTLPNVAFSPQAASNLILQFARKQIGQPYVWGGESRAEGGFDCSGIIYAAYKRAGYQGVGRTTYELIKQGVPVSWNQIMPGDIVFPSTHHVGIYLGNGKVLSAPRTGEKVHVSSINDFGGAAAGIRRLVNGGGGIIAPKKIAGIAPSGLPKPDPAMLQFSLAQQQAALTQSMAGIRQSLLVKNLPAAPDVPQPAASPTASLSNPLQAAAIDERSTTLTGLRQEAMRRAGL